MSKARSQTTTVAGDPEAAQLHLSIVDLARKAVQYREPAFHQRDCTTNVYEEQAEAFRVAALAEMAETPAEAVAQLVLVSEDLDELLGHVEQATKVRALVEIPCIARILRVMESTMRLLEASSGLSRRGFGTYGEAAFREPGCYWLPPLKHDDEED